jgi:putative peptidoglycan lipid II flippase
MSRVIGLGPAADAFAAALRIPNLLQNLLGEGVLSASFVPVYSQLLDEEDEREASRVAGAVAAALITLTGIGVIVIITLARPLTAVLAPGLNGQRYELAVEYTRIMALGTGFLVLSAWCLGVLNSHRRFFLSYVAPVVWNGVQIAALVVAWAMATDVEDAARSVAWAVTIGGAAQLLVQLPTTLRLARGLRLRYDRRNPRVRDVGRRFGPALAGRGVVQISAYLDLAMASMLAVGAVAALFKAQILYILPVSLFAMSVAAAELPEMSRLTGDPEALVDRAEKGVRRVAFWMLLATVVYITAGDLIIATLFEGGEFGADDTVLVWFVLSAYALGLPAVGVSRMLQNTCYALGDTRGPARIAGIRVLISAGVAVALMFPLDRVLVGPDGLIRPDLALGHWAPLPDAVREVDGVARLGAVGIALGSALAAWIELLLLARITRRRATTLRPIGAIVAAPARAAALAFVVTAALKLAVDPLPVLLATPIVVGAATVVYTTACHRTGVTEAEMLLRPARRLMWR